MIRRLSIPALLALSACNAIAGVDDYVNVACVKSCGVDGSAQDAQGEAAAFDGGALADAAGSDTGADADATPPALAPCPNGGEGRIELTVAGSAATVTSNPPGLTLQSGSAASACFPVSNMVDLRTNGPAADWTGAACKNGNASTDRCELTPLSNGLRVLVTVK